MKFIKGILLYVVYPLMMFGIGIFVGIESVQFFYPGDASQGTNSTEEVREAEESQLYDAEKKPQDIGNAAASEADIAMQKNVNRDNFGEPENIREVSSKGETLSVDTKYILEETDIVNETVVETTWKLPDEYVGMTREQFLMAMESYAAFPPLAEMERGFVGLEVLSFSREKVVVQMNYQYLQPSSSFYLAVRGNEVVVYLEDMETIFINTGIELETLPENVQLDIIQMLWVEDEEELYDFLETYSS